MLKESFKPTVKFVSLGCPKNLVDSEIMAGSLDNGDYTVVGEDADADIGVINTCGFIEASKQESIDTILELAQEKKAGKLKLIVVTGCLSQRYKEDLPKLLPEVDAFLGTGDFASLKDVIAKKLGGSRVRNFIRTPSEELPTAGGARMHTTPFYTRYLKISEGCSHTCSFCTIPLMRGGLKSRTPSDVLLEMEMGIDSGVKEFNLIAQDLNEYGRDLTERSSLYGLLEEMGKLKGDFWIRPLYMYPLQFPDRLIRLMRDHPHLLPYVDIPLQHIDDAILKSMNRGSSSKYIHRLIENLKKEIPGVVIRTTFIAGYPGETEEQFLKLKSFIQEMEFDRVGVFPYSQEEDTPAAVLSGQHSMELACERRDILMETQQAVSIKKNKGLIGKTVKVLFEGLPSDVPSEAPSSLMGIGRYYGQAPEIDGMVCLVPGKKNGEPKVGQFVNVRVTESLAYDLVGEII